MIRAFAGGAEATGHQITYFELQKMDIRPCRDCGRGGGSPESPCVQKDGMQKIYTAYREADVVCLASPLYFWTISGQLKCVVDRLYSVAECDGDLAHPAKECVLLMAAEGNEYEEAVFWYDNLMKHLNWKGRGKVLCGGVYTAGDIAENEKLKDAYELGKGL